MEWWTGAWLDDGGGRGILMPDFSVLGSHSVPDADSTLVLLGGALTLVGALSPRFRK